MATFPTGVKQFANSNHIDGIDIAPHINDIQDEIKAIETNLLANPLSGVTALDDLTLSITNDTLSGVTYGSTVLHPELTWAGGTTDPDDYLMCLYYQKVGKFTFINATIKVTDKTNSDRTSVSFPIPPGLCGMDTVLFCVETVTSSTPIGIMALVTAADNKVAVTFISSADKVGSIQIMGVVQEDAYVDPTP